MTLDTLQFNLKLLSKITVHDTVPARLEALYRRPDRVTLEKDIGFETLSEALEMTTRLNGSRPGFFLMSAENTQQLFRHEDYTSLIDVFETDELPGQIGRFLGMELFSECSLAEPLRRLRRTSLMFPFETMSTH